jgi:hypothetical protein
MGSAQLLTVPAPLNHPHRRARRPPQRLCRRGHHLLGDRHFRAAAWAWACREGWPEASFQVGGFMAAGSLPQGWTTSPGGVLRSSPMGRIEKTVFLSYRRGSIGSSAHHRPRHQ